MSNANGWQPIETCTREALAGDPKALLWARVMLHPFPDRLAFEPYWTDWTVWKGLWYSHRGAPCYASSWGPSYMPMDGCPGAMQVTHWMPLPGAPL